MSQISEPFALFFDTDGSPLEAGRVYVGEAGLDAKTNQVQVYSDDALTVPVDQPVRTIGGRPTVLGDAIVLYVAEATVSISTENRNGVPVITNGVGALFVLSSDLASTATSKGAALVGYKATASANASTVKAALDARAIPITDYGSVGTSDDSTVMQAALDDCETSNRPLLIPDGTTINLNGTVYIGDVTIYAKGATINCVLDANFTQRGTATRKNEGCILTKSAAAAGYGATTVSIKYDELNIVTTRSDLTSTIKTGLLLENTAAFVGGAIFASATTSVAGECTPLDFYGGCQGVDTGVLWVTLNNGLNAGGLWIRSLVTTRETKNVKIAGIVASGSSNDELVAIYNAVAQPNDISDIDIGFIHCYPDSGRGQGLSILQETAYDPDYFRNINIGSVTVIGGDVAAAATSSFLVKFKNCSPNIGSVNLVTRGNWNGLTTMFALRSEVDGSQTDLPKIGAVNLQTEFANTAATTTSYAIFGDMEIGTLVSGGAGTGWTRIVDGVGHLPSVKIAGGSFTLRSIANAKRVRGDVAGRMEAVSDFEGIHRLDQDTYGSVAGWFYYGTGAATEKAIRYKADVRVSGSGAFGQVVRLDTASGDEIPAHIEYVLDNPSSLSRTDDSFATKIKVIRVEISIKTAGAITAVKRSAYFSGATLTVASGVITPVGEIHLVDTEGAAATDDLNGINGGKFTGQVVRLIAADAARITTLKHNVNNIQTRTGVDIALSATGFVEAMYHAGLNKWLIDA